MVKCGIRMILIITTGCFFIYLFFIVVFVYQARTYMTFEHQTREKNDFNDPA